MDLFKKWWFWILVIIVISIIFFILNSVYAPNVYYYDPLPFDDGCNYLEEEECLNNSKCEGNYDPSILYTDEYLFRRCSRVREIRNNTGPDIILEKEPFKLGQGNKI